MVAEAFRRLPLPAATLQIQPPGGRTLVNFATNFYTDRGAFTRGLTLLGQRVTLRIEPVSFTWRFGDGTTTTTTTPGAPYPALDVTHTYLRADPVSPSVDTTYGATWRVGNGAWGPVPGTVTIAGGAVDLAITEARPTLVSYE